MKKALTDAEAKMTIYLCQNAPTPWGDWGSALIHGLIGWDETTDVDSIERAGPFTPPAYICWGSLIFTQPIKEALEASKLKGIRYEHLEKTHIVRIDWQDWDVNKPITDYIDLDGGPSSIIEGFEHDPSLARQMPDYWRALVTGRLNLRTVPEQESNGLSSYLQILKADNADFFKADVHGGYFVSEKAKIWLNRHCPGCFNFLPIHLAK
ncbi:hypothetical protein [Pseudomonas alabamensis]|uniref:hypothetical protein n=1 Tax=Pseudomonas alabamensis TaxID=3064349 RepID=UPI003F64BED1